MIEEGGGGEVGKQRAMSRAGIHWVKALAVGGAYTPGPPRSRPHHLDTAIQADRNPTQLQVTHMTATTARHIVDAMQ